MFAHTSVTLIGLPSKPTLINRGFTLVNTPLDQQGFSLEIILLSTLPFENRHPFEGLQHAISESYSIHTHLRLRQLVSLVRYETRR